VDGYGHSIKVSVPSDFNYFPGIVRGGIAIGAELRNVVIAVSTGAPHLYDVFISWLPEIMEISEFNTIPLADRCVEYVGCYSLLQVLFALWPILSVPGNKWEECYTRWHMEIAITMYVRHSKFPCHWLTRMVPMDAVDPGEPFYGSLWSVVAPAVYGRGDDLNVSDYLIVMVTVKDAGPVTIFWPRSGGYALWETMMFLCLTSVATPIHVPFRFACALWCFYHEWQDALCMDDWHVSEWVAQRRAMSVTDAMHEVFDVTGRAGHRR
jgi:hypothetical protein